MNRMFSAKEPPLHEAVIRNDLKQFEALVKQPEVLKQGILGQTNHLGFTALELARFLARDAMLKLIEPETFQHQIKITFRDLSEAIDCSIIDLKSILGVKYRPHLYFNSYDSFKDTLKQCPFLLRSSYFNSEGVALHQRHIQKVKAGFVADVEVKWTGTKKGYGLFALTDFEPQTYIGEYTGLVRQLFRFKPDHNSYCFHYPTRWWSLKYLMVDASKFANEIRFANHSYHPNMEPFCLVDRKLLHTVLLTNQAVKKGEELTFNYGPDYWGHRFK